jgi:hypothetical protein
VIDAQIITAALGAVVTAAAAILLADRLRSALRPTGTHRGGAEPLTPSEFRHCPEEDRSTFHAIHADGSRTCWTCLTCTVSELSE